MKKKVILLLMVCFYCLTTFSQNINKPEDVLQQVVDAPYAFFEISKYPSAMDIINTFSNGRNPNFKKMKVGEKYRVLGFDSDKYTWPRYIKIQREKTGAIGWIITKVIEKRECLLPLFPNTRSEMIPSILNHELVPGMNADDIFLAINLPVYEDWKQSYDKDYTTWTNPNKITDEMIFYKGELCLNNTDYKMRFYFKPKISYSLSTVECSDSILKKGVVIGSNYSDDNISIEWTTGRTQLHFVIKNQSNASIKLLWDDMSYVKYNKTHRVIHKGIRLNDKELEQANSVVPKGASYDDMLMPTDNIKYNNYSKAWEAEDLDIMFYESPKDSRNRDILEKSTFQVLFPIIINGKRIEYTFNFSAKEVEFEQSFGSYYSRTKL